MDGPTIRRSLRGYSREEVDELLLLVRRALDSSDPTLRAEATEALRSARFAVVMRGYDRGDVESLVADAARQLGSAG